jgi:hypothetical protein
MNTASTPLPLEILSPDANNEFCFVTHSRETTYVRAMLDEENVLNSACATHGAKI